MVLIRKEWRTEKGEKKKDHWAITSPEPFPSGRALVEFYHLRSRIEEVNRQLKQPRRLDRFTSPEYSLVIFHVVFTLLTDSLIQFYLMQRERWDLTRSFLRTLQREESLGQNAVIVYAEDSFSTFNQEDYTKMLLQLPRPARQWMLKDIEAKQKEREGWAKGEEGTPGPTP